MTLYRTKTTAERIRIIENCRASLSRIVRACNEAQVYHDNCSDFANRTANIDARMTAITADVNVVIGELTDLVAIGNMQFQYIWTVGKHGIKAFNLNATTDILTCLDALAADSGVSIAAFAGNPVAAADIMLLTGTSLNNERLVVDSVASTGLTFTAATVDADEEVEATGAELKLLLVDL